MFTIGQLSVKFGSFVQKWFPCHIRGGLVDFISSHDKEHRVGLGLQGRQLFSGKYEHLPLTRPNDSTIFCQQVTKVEKKSCNR